MEFGYDVRDESDTIALAVQALAEAIQKTGERLHEVRASVDETFVLIQEVTDETVTYTEEDTGNTVTVAKPEFLKSWSGEITQECENDTSKLLPVSETQRIRKLSDIA